MLVFAASAGASRPVALRAPSREAPAENIPSLINAPVFKQRFQEEATSILTQGVNGDVWKLHLHLCAKVCLIGSKVSPLFAKVAKFLLLNVIFHKTSLVFYTLIFYEFRRALIIEIVSRS